MTPFHPTRRTWFSWLSVAALILLCCVLAVLQYRWIGEVSRAERERLQASLQASLFRLSQDLSAEITNASAVLALSDRRGDEDLEGSLGARYQRWKESTRHSNLVRRIAVAEFSEQDVTLRLLDFEKGSLEPAEWPASWSEVRERFLERGSRDGGRRGFDREPAAGGLLFEIPRFRRPPFAAGRSGGPAGGRPEGREFEVLLFEFNEEYVTATLIPEALQRHLGSDGHLSYQVEVLTREKPARIVFQSEPGAAKRIGTAADASIGIIDLQFDRLMRRGGSPGYRDGGRRPPVDPSSGRWLMLVRHNAGSLEAVVARARVRNLAVMGGILLLIVATIVAMLRFTRQAQVLADVQMQFVAGVSHELRTPLTVIRTAAYNLRGKVAANPGQVERYGALIQQESEKLTELVEQVLRFAGAKAGQVIRDREPVDVETLIRESIQSSKANLEHANAEMECDIQAGLPLVLADAISLRHALQNLLSNAAKYGTEGSRWIGVSARETTEGDRHTVEIRVADRGPGIPHEEQSRIFDPFFRGKRAVQDQVHGTGLGLSLVKGIVEAHGGTIKVQSEPMKGTEFVVRLPAEPLNQQDEYTHTLSRG